MHRLPAAVLALATFAAPLAAEPAWRADWRAANAAAQAGDAPGALAHLDATLAARPDYPRALLARARVLTATGDLGRAVLALEQHAHRGLAADLAAFDALSTQPGYAQVAERLAANASPAGSPTTFATLPAQTGILESVARADDGTLYIADVRHGCVWRRDPAGAVERFDRPAGPLGGCFSLVLDASRGVLWVSTSTVPETAAPAADAAPFTGVVALDLTSGRETQRIALAEPGGDHVLGSLRLGPDGALYASDSSAPVVWRAEHGSSVLEPWIRNDGFLSLQGLAFDPDGRSLHLADYANGLWTVDLASRSVRRVEPAADACLFGIDELLAADEGLVAVQNGLAPTRLLRIRIVDGVASVEVLARGLPGLDDASTGLLVGGDLVVVAGSGWALAAQPGGPPAARDVELLRFALATAD